MRGFRLWRAVPWQVQKRLLSSHNQVEEKADRTMVAVVSGSVTGSLVFIGLFKEMRWSMEQGTSETDSVVEVVLASGLAAALIGGLITFILMPI